MTEPVGPGTGLQVHVHPGDGVVAKLGSALLVVPYKADGFAGFESILTAVGHEADIAAVDGRRLLRRLAGILLRDVPEDVPPFAVIVMAADGVALMVHGAVDVTVGAPGEEHRFSGRLVPTWVDRIVEGPIDFVQVSASGSDVPKSAEYFDLRDGVVPGIGASLLFKKDSNSQTYTVPVSEPLSPPMPDIGTETEPRRPVEPDSMALNGSVAQEAQPAPTSETASTLLGDSGPSTAVAGVLAEASLVLSDARAAAAEASLVVDTPVSPQEALRPTSPVMRPPSPARSTVMVKGILCSMGHFNSPRALFCTMCGMSMVHQPHELVDGVRLPLGVLVADDGSVYSVDRDYVLGRQPQEDPDVQAGRATALVLNDAGLTVSSVHAAIILREWDVCLVDRSSVRGTAVLEEPNGQWRALTPGEPMVLAPRTRIRIGARSLSFDTTQRR